MATTTNYGWTTPDNTALVKDGASAIRTLGSSVDTSLKSLSPGTTAGDVDYYTSSTAKARLGIGTTGQVLTVAGGVPSWATPSGSLTLSQVASGNINSGTTVSISGLTQDFIQIQISGVTWASGNDQLQGRINGTSSASYANAVGAIEVGGANTVGTSTGWTEMRLGSIKDQVFNNATNLYVITMWNCKSSGFTYYQYSNSFRAATGQALAVGDGMFKVAAQVTSFSLFTVNGYSFNGSGTYTVLAG